jgi:hypothetical protein
MDEFADQRGDLDSVVVGATQPVSAPCRPSANRSCRMATTPIAAIGSQACTSGVRQSTEGTVTMEFAELMDNVRGFKGTFIPE